MSFEKYIPSLIIGVLGMVLFLFSEKLAHSDIFSRMLGNHGSIEISDNIENRKYLSFAYKLSGIVFVIVSIGLFVFFLFH
jgi:hypothetical protein